MSGPKGASYVVVSAAELERRALVRAQARLTEVLARFALLQADAQAARDRYGDQIAPVTVSQPRRVGDSIAHDQLAEQLEADLVEVRRTLDRQLSTARFQAISDQARDEAAAAGPTIARLGKYEKQARAVATPEPVSAEVTAAVERAVERLRTTDEAAQERIAGLGRLILATTDTAGAARLVRVLQDEVQQANANQRRVDARAAEIRELGAALLGRESTEITTLRAALTRLAATPDEPVPAGIAAAVAAAVAAADAAADRAFALDVAADCLGELGYEVSEGFDTVVASGGFTYLRRAGWPGYAIQLHATANQQQLGFNVVREADGTTGGAMTTRDTEIEEEWCTDFAALREAMSARGVRVDLTRATPPGALAVQRVRTGALPRRGHRAGTVRHDQARQREVR